jgi:hypothetical protein
MSSRNRSLSVLAPQGTARFLKTTLEGCRGCFGTVENASTNGGYDTYLTGIEATMDQVSKVQVAGLGDQAVVFTGLPKMGSGENFMAGGGDRPWHVSVAGDSDPRQGMARPDLEAVAEGILRRED